MRAARSPRGRSRWGWHAAPVNRAQNRSPSRQAQKSLSTRARSSFRTQPKNTRTARRSATNGSSATAAPLPAGPRLAKITHTFTKPGTYTVSVKLPSDFGTYTPPSATAIVTPAEGLTPHAQFTITSPPGAQQAVFDASGSTPGTCRTIAYYLWNWGDGTPPESDGPQTPTLTHTYAEPRQLPGHADCRQQPLPVGRLRPPDSERQRARTGPDPDPKWCPHSPRQSRLRRRRRRPTGLPPLSRCVRASPAGRSASGSPARRPRCPARGRCGSRLPPPSLCPGARARAGPRALGRSPEEADWSPPSVRRPSTSQGAGRRL